MTEVALAPVPDRQLLDSDISHEVCCIDEQAPCDRISMCGLPLADDGESGPDEPTCVVCMDLIELWAYNVDTYGENPQRPDDPPCRVCPRRSAPVRRVE